MADTKAIIAGWLDGARSPLPAANAPATNGHANPLLLSEQSEYAETITRGDASTIATPGGFYGGSGGNTVSNGQLETIATRNSVEPNSRTSPAGEPIPGGLGY